MEFFFEKAGIEQIYGMKNRIAASIYSSICVIQCASDKEGEQHIAAVGGRGKRVRRFLGSRLQRLFIRGGRRCH